MWSRPSIRLRKLEKSTFLEKSVYIIEQSTFPVRRWLNRKLLCWFILLWKYQGNYIDNKKQLVSSNRSCVNVTVQEVTSNRIILKYHSKRKGWQKHKMRVYIGRRNWCYSIYSIYFFSTITTLIDNLDFPLTKEFKSLSRMYAITNIWFVTVQCLNSKRAKIGKRGTWCDNVALIILFATLFFFFF